MVQIFRIRPNKSVQIDPPLSSLRTWGCVAHVRMPREYRHRKVKLEPRGENCRFHKKFTMDGTYVKQLLENRYLDTL
ncbi:hypothetical protein PC120_g9181 [Phytophthora cactorum]|nr:hypothetical protein PC120_g9181 [Phytophthora cactorum]